MRFTTGGTRTILLLVAALITGDGSGLSGQERPNRPARKAPKVRLASPEAAYVMEPAAGKKVLVVLEIVDVSGTGIKVDRSGMPQFVHPGGNEVLFASEVVARGTYVDDNGRDVLQIASFVPIDRLVMEEKQRIPPPVNFRRLRPAQGDRAIVFPEQAMIPCARFRFQVEDLQGNRSTPYAGHLTIGFATALFEPDE